MEVFLGQSAEVAETELAFIGWRPKGLRYLVFAFPQLI
jgi:hypothetical protein